MRIGVVGTGYVGAVTGVCLAHVGCKVVCFDVDNEKIKAFQSGVSPIHESGLNDYLTEALSSRHIQFTSNLNEMVLDSEIIFICVGTPSKSNGEVDMSYIDHCLKDLLPKLRAGQCIVFKSTVPVGTAYRTKQLLKELNLSKEILVASNPEFLKEGTAINDFLRPERVILGVEDKDAEELLKKVYCPLNFNGHPILVMDHASAELAKYVCNAMLATRISFINEVANLCSSLDADINQVRQALTTDSRIGSKFLYPSLGFGGQCLPKDIRGLIFQAERAGLSLSLMSAVEEVNNAQKVLLFEKFQRWAHRENISCVAVWGTAFKAETDDIRESGAVVLIEKLLAAGLRVQAHDPVATKNTRGLFSSHTNFSMQEGAGHLESLLRSQALFICTEWKIYRTTSLEKIAGFLRRPAAIFDGRNLFWKKDFERFPGLDYFGIGQQLTSRDMASQPEVVHRV